MSHNSPDTVFKFADILRGVPTDADIEQLFERNALRQEEARLALGARWVGWIKPQEPFHG